jgi:hypothetical protein
VRSLVLLLALSLTRLATAFPHHAVVRFADLQDGSAEVESDDSPPMPVPQNLPVPFAFASAAEQSRAAVPEAAASAIVRDSFAAIGDDNTTVPPDTAGAVGRDHLLVALNSQLRIQSRTGTTLRTATTRSLFDPVRGTYRTFDPRVLFDPRTDRWYISVITDQKTTANSQRTGSATLLAISRSADPLAAWDLYRFDAPSGIWYDFPSLGFDATRIVISLNAYNVTDNKFNRAHIYVLDKIHPDQSPAQIDLTGSGGTLVPATSYDDSPTMYMIEQWNGNSRGSGYLRLYTVSRDGVAPVGFVSVPHTWAAVGTADNTDFAPQAGSTAKIDTGDNRLLAAYYRNGSIWTVQTIFVPSAAPTRSAVQWWQVSVSAAVQQNGVVDDAQGVFFYAYPSIAVNKRGDVLIAGTRFSATTVPSAFFTFRNATDAENATAAPVVFKEGESSYTKINSTFNRWGDYSTAAVDPVNDTDFWTIQEYAATPNAGTDRWGTWWVHVQLAEPQIAPKRRAARH